MGVISQLLGIRQLMIKSDNQNVKLTTLVRNFLAISVNWFSQKFSFFKIRIIKSQGFYALVLFLYVILC